MRREVGSNSKKRTKANNRHNFAVDEKRTQLSHAFNARAHGTRQVI
jgi:hypothetical protein